MLLTGAGWLGPRHIGSVAMTQKSRILLLLAAGALMPLAPAHAADYDPPIFVEEAVEFVPVEVGSGWYLRGDVGYVFNEPFRNDVFGNDPIFSFSEKFNPVSASIGMGYNWTDYFRTEMNVGFLPGGRSNLDFLTVDGGGVVVSDVSLATKNELWSGMVNAYADLGTFVGVTPYVGAGIGVVYNKRSFSASQDFVDPVFVDTDFSDTERHFDFAYSLGAGVNYAVTKNVSVDLGYEYFSAPEAEYAEITGPASYSIKEGIDFHQVKVGLRYDLW